MGDEELPNLSTGNKIHDENSKEDPKKQRNFRALLAQPKLVLESKTPNEVSKKSLLSKKNSKIKEKLEVFSYKEQSKNETESVSSFHSCSNNEVPFVDNTKNTSGSELDKVTVNALVALLDINQQETEVKSTQSEGCFDIKNRGIQVDNPTKKRKRSGDKIAAIPDPSMQGIGGEINQSGECTESLINESTQTQDGQQSVLDNGTKNSGVNNIKNVSFQEQEKPEEKDAYFLPPEVMEVYRRARAAKMAEIKHTARKEHLQRLFDTERYAPWALNCGQWPDNLLTTDEKNGFVNLHKLHAKPTKRTAS